MNERNLESLKDMEIPPPSAGAEARALNEAMTAFREVNAKSGSRAQGSAWRERLKSIFDPSSWRWTMERRMMIGTAAASLVALTVAGQWALEQGHLDALRRVAPSPSSVTQKRDVPKTEPAPAMAERSTSNEVRASRDDGSQPLFEAEEDAAAPIGRLAQERSELTVAEAPAAAPAAGKRFGFSDNRQFARPVPTPPADTVAAPEPSRDRFTDFDVNPVKAVAEEPVSTFSIDVDTASYAFVRRMINEGRLPDPDAVRVEEMINYFSYDYPAADSLDEPFSPTVAVYPTPWNAETKLMHVGIKGYEVSPAAKPKSNLVFLIDVSGSMQSADKLPLLKSAFRLLLDSLEADDTVSIVTYAGEAGTALEPTKASERRKILSAIDGLGAGGSTAGAAGIAAAYALAEEAFVEGGVNRVVLATDGDFNVGVTDQDSLEEYIEKKRQTGIYLSILGFGAGNYNDALMQTLAQNGNGNAAYIDTLNEARKVLVEEAVSTLVPIATDVKIQVEFNPATVSEYRLIGYETRALNREDFNNDKVDAGDIGSGHTVTAIYEVTPTGSPARLLDDLRYQPRAADSSAGSDEYAFLRLRYQTPGETISKLIERPVTTADEAASIDGVSTDMRFAASVAAFGQRLAGGAYLGDFTYDDIATLAQGARGADPFGYRAEFLTLVRLASSLDTLRR